MVSKTKIDSLESQITILDEHTAKLIELIPNTLSSINCIGLFIKRVLLLKLVTLIIFNQASHAKFVGLAWSQYQSSGFESEHTHLIHSGNKYLKYYLIQVSFTLHHYDKEFKR